MCVAMGDGGRYERIEVVLDRQPSPPGMHPHLVKLHTLARFLGRQAMGLSTGSHGPFKGYSVEALTLSTMRYVLTASRVGVHPVCCLVTPLKAKVGANASTVLVVCLRVVAQDRPNSQACGFAVSHRFAGARRSTYPLCLLGVSVTCLLYTREPTVKSQPDSTQKSRGFRISLCVGKQTGTRVRESPSTRLCQLDIHSGCQLQPNEKIGRASHAGTHRGADDAVVQ